MDETRAAYAQSMTSDPAARLRGFPGLLLALRFLSELALLAGFSVAAARLGGDVLFSVLGAVLAPALAATIWGLTLAPRARRRLADPLRLLVESALFAAAGMALAASGLVVTGVVLAVAGITLAALLRRFAPGS